MTSHPSLAPQGDRGSAPRRAWTRPSIVALPRLTELTLQTGPGIPGGGGTGGGGSTVIP